MNRVRAAKSGNQKGGGLLAWLQHMFLWIGLLLVGYYAFAQGEMYFFQSYESWRLDQIQQGQPDSIARYVEQWIPFWGSAATGKPADSGTPHRQATRRAKGLSRGESLEGSLIGRIQIPRLALSAMVLEGVGSGTLRLAVGHLPGTPLPGEQGNVDLAAHRDTFFRGLQRVRDGDLVSLSATNGQLYRYRVDSIMVTEPNNTQILNTAAGPGLNLITCYPFNYVGPAPKRFVVHADEISESAALPDTLASSPRRLRTPRQRAQHTGKPLAAPGIMKSSATVDLPRTARSPSVTEETIAPEESDPPPSAAPSATRFSGIRKFLRKVFKSKRSG